MAPRIALGMTNGIDWEIRWDDKTITRLIEEYRITSASIRKLSIISSMEDLLSSILYFMRKGEGASAYVSDIKINTDFASYFDYITTIGGAGTRAGIAIGKLGYSSIVHLVSNNETTRQLLPDSITTYCGNDHDTFYPHLIVQYPAGARIRTGDIDITTTRANRLMYLHDPDIMTMPVSKDFFKAAKDCNVLLIGSFTTLPDPEDGLRKAEEVLSYIHEYSAPDIEIYYEDSNPPRGLESGHNKIWKRVAKEVSIFGLNEDELQNHIGRKIDLMNPSEVTQALKELKELFPCSCYVLHSKHYALAYGENAGKYKSSLLAGIAMATGRLVHGDALTKADIGNIKLRRTETESELFAKEMNEANPDIVALPSFEVNESSVTTIGLGDAFVGGFIAELSDCLERMQVQ